MKSGARKCERTGKMPVKRPSKQTASRSISVGIFAVGLICAFLLGVFYKAHNLDAEAIRFYKSFESPAVFFTSMGLIITIGLNVYRTFKNRKGD